jgi:CheY-like chemotaxis protein
MEHRETVTIVLVEDDPGHAVLIEKNLRRAGITSTIVTLNDGRKAVDFLLNTDGRRNGALPEPEVILLDLNLPVLDGYQVLKIIKNDERTRQIPVIILTTTDNPAEVAKCYELGCNLYVTKPVEYEAFSRAIQNLGLLLSIIKVPHKEYEIFRKSVN